MANPTFGTFATLTTGYTFNGNSAGDLFGEAVAGAGDVNGDGFADLIVGAKDDDNRGSNSGSAQVFSGADGSVLYTINGSSMNDWFGGAVAGAGDVNGDGIADLIIGATGDDNNGNTSGSARVVSGANGSTLYTFNGEAIDALGESVASAGDVNGDGFDDVIVGAGYNDAGGTDAGTARVHSGADGSLLYKFDGDDAGDYFGSWVAGAGDVNGDGIPDLIVGAKFDDNNGSSSGSARVFSGSDGSVLYTFNGGGSNYSFGISVSGAGDVNNDGFADLIVGASGKSPGGSAQVFSGADGTVLYTFDGETFGDRLGYSVAGAGDVDGDGFDDLLVGASRDDDNGTDSGSARIHSGADGSVLFTFNGDSAEDEFGYSVAAAGDVNGDGFADVIVGANEDDNNGANSGSARVFVSSVSNGLGSSVSFTEDGAAVVLDDDVDIVDADLDALNGGAGDYAGSNLVLEREGGRSGEDVFSFDLTGASFTVQGSALLSGGDAFATFTQDGGRLTINFTSLDTAATSALADEVAQAIAYENTSDTPSAFAPIRWTFTDDTGADTTGLTSVAITAANDGPSFDRVTLSEGYAFNGDAADDGFGISVASAGDVDGDGLADLIVGAYRDDNNGTDSGSARVLSGADGAVLYTFNGDSANEWFGHSVAGAGDVDGDGHADLIFGAPDGGRVEIYSGANGALLYDLSGAFAGSQFGYSVDSAGDVNGDGFADVIIGAISSSGSATVFSGVDGSVLYTFDGDDANDQFGFSVSGAGDVNGDGFADLIVSAPYDDNNGLLSGSARVVSGMDGSVLYTFDGDDANDLFGFSVSGAGDVNNDGFADFIVGAIGDDNNGNGSGSATVFSGVDGSVLHTFDGDGAADSFGWSVAGAGDVNGDGFADLIVGARGDDNNGIDSGSARIFSGADGTVIATFDGANIVDEFGTFVSGAGDVNGDGLADLIVGAPGADTNNGINSGSARVFLTALTSSIDATPTFIEDGSAIVLDSDVAISDPELDALNAGAGNYNGASFTLERNGGANAEDIFSFAAMANVTINGAALEAGGNAIATITNTGGTLSITFTDGNGSIPTRALVNEILSAVQYANASDAPPSSINLDWNFSDGASATTDTQTITITGIDDAPTLDTNTGSTLAEGGVDRIVAAELETNDVDTADLDIIYTLDNLTAYGSLWIDTDLSGTINGAEAALQVSDTFTQADIANGLLTYAHNGLETTTDRFEFSVTDGATPATGLVFDFSITPVDDPAVAQDDAFAILETGSITGGSVLSDNGNGADTDPDTALAVTSVNGSAGDVGSQITLASGALLTLNANGTFDYDPNGQFEHVPLNATDTDSFTYEVNGVEATVTVTITGIDNDDIVIGTSGSDDLSGGVGNDSLIGGAGFDSYDGGSGSDTVDFAGAAGWVIDLGAGSATTLTGYTTETLVSIENVIGSDGDDRITGTNRSNDLDGGGGDDTLIGGGGVDDFYGGSGFDTVDLSGSNSKWRVDLGAGTAELTTATGNVHTSDFVGIESVIGPRNSMTFIGTSGNEKATGSYFADIFYARGGVDEFHGGNGSDTVSFGNYGEGLTIRGTAGYARLGDGTQVTTFTGIENIFATSEDDDITGTSGNNTIVGRSGADKIHGGSGDDIIQGDLGRDLLTGGRGNDRIDGGSDPNDYAFFSGNQDQYTISTTGGVTTVEWIGPGAGDGTDTLTNIEFLGFDDGFFYV